MTDREQQTEALAALLSQAFHFRPDDLGEGWGTWDYLAEQVMSSDWKRQNDAEVAAGALKRAAESVPDLPDSTGCQSCRTNAEAHIEVWLDSLARDAANEGGGA